MASRPHRYRVAATSPGLRIVEAVYSTGVLDRKPLPVERRSETRIGVAQHALDVREGNSVLKKERGEGMPEVVGRVVR